MRTKNNTLWIVGEIIKHPLWSFQGVFDSQTRATKACKTSNYFVAPAKLNEEFPKEMIDWPNCFYPIPCKGGTK